MAPWPLAPRSSGRQGAVEGGGAGVARWVTGEDSLLVLGADTPVGVYVVQLAADLGASVTAVCDRRSTRTP